MSESLWIATAPAAPRSQLQKDAKAEVVVVGGGMLGITAAYILARDGHDVMLLESRAIVEGVTGNTTGKVTAQHGLIYDRLIRDVGTEKARLHAQANERGRQWVVDAIRTSSIDAELAECAAYVYATNEEERQQVIAEVDAAKAVGLPASLEDVTELPFAAPAVRFEAQTHIHPRKYLLELARLAEEHGARIHEQSPVTGVHDGSPCKVTTPRAEVQADHVIVATNVPINDRLYFTPRMQPQRAYGVACPMDPLPFEDMYISAGAPVRSLRPYTGEASMVVAVGENHPVGTGSDTQRHNDTLLAFVQEHFGATRAQYQWSTQDFWPVDGYPYIGAYSPKAKHTWTATGFQGWGLSQATAAAMMLSQRIQGEESPWNALYDPFDGHRVLSDVIDKKFLKQQFGITKGFIKERLRDYPLGDVAPGTGKIAELDGKKLAVHRDREGDLHARPAQCTHMGCFVTWNQGEQSWDCPCHGSRFAARGAVLHGPATKPLEASEAEAAATAEDARTKPDG